MGKQGGKQVRFCRLLVAVSALSVVSALAATPAYAQEESRRFDVPAQPLSSALLTLGRQAGISISAPRDLTRGRTSRAVSGNLSTRDAITRLLEGSGLRFEFVNGSAVRIFAGNAAIPGSGEAQAAGAAAENESVAQQEIVVTGTNIRGVAPAGAPLATYDREDIARTGSATVDDFMRTLPQNLSDIDGSNAILTSVFEAAASFTGGASANLRGLGPGATLVLLDGQRLAPAGREGAAVEISSIPLSAIERVEVLTDGASAIYGTDAVAGVINYVLRRDYEGAETTLRYGDTQDGGRQLFGITQAVGHRWASGSAFASYDFLDSDPVLARQRDFIAETNGVRGGSFVVPSRRSHSGILTIQQDLGASTNLRATATYSDRRFAGAQDTLGLLSTYDGRSKNLSLILGLRQGLGRDWELNAVGAYSLSDEQRQNQSFFNPGQPPSSITDFASLSTITSADIRADGPVLQIGSGQARASIGMHYRRETFENAGFGPAIQANREVRSAFAEVYVPLVSPQDESNIGRRLSLSVAGRYDDYSDAGSSFNPRVGVEWEVAEGLTYRGSYSTSYRVAPLAQLSPLGERALTTTFFSAPGVRNLRGILRLGSNPDLTPETSRSITAGVDISPPALTPLRISATYFNIEYQNRIATAPANGSLILGLLQLNVLAPYFNLTPSPAEIGQFYSGPNFTNSSNFPQNTINLIADGRVQNIGSSKTSGVDVTADYSADVGAWTISPSISAQYMARNTFRAAPTTSTVETVNTLFRPLRWKLRGSIFAQSGGFNIGLTGNHVPSYRNTSLVPEGRISSWTTFDLFLSYRISDQAPEWIRGTRGSVTISNIANEAPPTFQSLGRFNGYDPVNANPLGRTFSFVLTRSW